LDVKLNKITLLETLSQPYVIDMAGTTTVSTDGTFEVNIDSASLPITGDTVAQEGSQGWTFEGDGMTCSN